MINALQDETNPKPMGDAMPDETPKGLLNQPIKVINVGLEGFSRDLAEQDVPVLQVQWTPPAGGNPKLADLLAKLGL